MVKSRSLLIEIDLDPWTVATELEQSTKMQHGSQAKNRFSDGGSTSEMDWVRKGRVHEDGQMSPASHA